MCFPYAPRRDRLPRATDPAAETPSFDTVPHEPGQDLGEILDKTGPRKSGDSVSAHGFGLVVFYHWLAAEQISLAA